MGPDIHHVHGKKLKEISLARPKNHATQLGLMTP